MILKLCILIPTYNNPLSIADVVDEVLAKTLFPLTVIDDGSEAPVRELLRSSISREAQTSGRLQIMRWEKNQGKGVALQKAFQFCLEKGFTHVLSMDGDGQHLVSELEPLIAEARKHPWDLIIGARQFESSNIPESSKFGRKFSNFWVKFQTGLPISDSQSGLRLYPLFRVQGLRFWCRRYDFEIEVLIRLMWRKTAIREVSVKVYYPKKEDRVSHFHKFHDNVRISLLNTLLVTLSLLRTKGSLKEVAIALGVGVFIGCTPFFGFHTLMVVAAALLFRMNAVYLWLGSQVSIPIIAPFIIVLSVAVGGKVFPGQSHFVQWLNGSFVVGAGLGILTSLTAWLLSFHFKQTPKKKNVVWNGRSRGGWFGNNFLKVILKFLGLRAGYFCLLFIVPYFYLFSPKGRRALNEYWALIRSDESWLRRQGRIMNQFYKFGQVLMDRVYKNFAQDELFKTYPNGIEHILAAHKNKTGLLLLSAHVGGWDIGSSLLDRNALPDGFYVLQYHADGFSFNHVKEGGFSAAPAQSSAGQTVFDIHQLLSSGKILGIMSDRPLGNRFELVSFFGRLAPFDVTAFRLAAALNTPLLFSFGFKRDTASYDFYASSAKEYRYLPNVDKELQCREWVQDFARHLESLLIKYPDQWFNFFSFWSMKPDSPVPSQADAENGKSKNYLQEELHKPTSLGLASALGHGTSDELKSPH